TAACGTSWISPESWIESFASPDASSPAKASSGSVRARSVSGSAGKQEQRIARNDDRNRRALVDAMRRVSPDVRAVRAHPIPITLPDVERLYHLARKFEIGRAHRFAGR